MSRVRRVGGETRAGASASVRADRPNVAVVNI
jgi:hypothetical protein